MIIDYIGRRAHRRMVKVAYASAAIIGYMLSPLSWWNDIVVNIPIAILAASFLHNLTGVNKEFLFIVIYWFTNVAGIVMMIMAGEGAIKGKTSLKSLAVSIIASLIYTLIVVGVLL